MDKLLNEFGDKKSIISKIIKNDGHHEYQYFKIYDITYYWIIFHFVYGDYTVNGPFNNFCRSDIKINGNAEKMTFGIKIGDKYESLINLFGYPSEIKKNNLIYYVDDYFGTYLMFTLNENNCIITITRSDALD